MAKWLLATTTTTTTARAAAAAAGVMMGKGRCGGGPWIGGSVVRMTTTRMMNGKRSGTSIGHGYDLRHGYATVSSPVLPQTIKPSKDEISSSALGPRNLEIAVRALHNDGLVVIEDAIAHPILDRLNEKMVEDCRTLQARGKDGPFNYNVGNLQVDPPPVKRFFDEKVFLNPIATQVTSAVLGPRPKWTFCSGNAAMPPIEGTEPQRQPVHSDADFAHPGHPFALVVNVPLVTMTPENGSTEIWLGTHRGYGIEAQEGMHGERASGKIRGELLEERKGKGMGPSQPVIKKGSVIVRDLRLWHAGMPNHRENVRVMLAMIHFAPWYRNRMKVELAEELKPLVDECKDLEIPAKFVSEKEAMEGYLNRGFGNSYDFNQTP